MIRILHIMPGADVGGISAVVLNYYQYMDRSRIHFTIAQTTEQFGIDGRKLKELGADFYTIPMKSQDYTGFKNALKKILSTQQYDAIHVHENETSYVALQLAKLMGVKKRFSHSHTSSPCGSIKDEIRRISGCILNGHYATHMLACGQLAGERVFGRWNMKRKRVIVLPNAIDTEKYAYNEAVRQQVRSELALEGHYVIGMVGRLSEEKNCAYALHLIEKFHAIKPNVKLVVVGNGKLENHIRHKVKQNGLQEYVYLLGARDDVHRLYQAMDVFIMPSLHEGFPVAAIEAMAAGLPVLLSSAITKELTFGNAVQYIALNSDREWISAMEQWAKDTERTIRGHEVRENGLDIRDTAKMLETLYLSEAER